MGHTCVMPRSPLPQPRFPRQPCQNGIAQILQRAASVQMADGGGLLRQPAKMPRAVAARERGIIIARGPVSKRKMRGVHIAALRDPRAVALRLAGRGHHYQMRPTL